MEFEVVKGVLNNGKQEARPGDSVELSKTEAEKLIEQGIVRPVGKRKKVAGDQPE